MTVSTARPLYLNTPSIPRSTARIKPRAVSYTHLITELYEDADDGNRKKNRLVTDSESADNLKVKGDWEEGKDLVDGLTITKKKVSAFGVYDDEDRDELLKDDGFAAGMGAYGYKEGSYYYMVALTVEDSSSTSDADIIGTLRCV